MRLRKFTVWSGPPSSETCTLPASAARMLPDPRVARNRGRRRRTASSALPLLTLGFASSEALMTSDPRDASVPMARPGADCWPAHATKHNRTAVAQIRDAGTVQVRKRLQINVPSADLAASRGEMNYRALGHEFFSAFSVVLRVLAVAIVAPFTKSSAIGIATIPISKCATRVIQ